MSDASGSSSIFRAFVITVGLEADVAERLIGAVERMPWMVSAAVLDSYVSEARRPYLGVSSRTADAVIAFVSFHQQLAALASVEYLRTVFDARLVLVAVASQRDPDLLLGAMRAGCSEFLETPFDWSALDDLLGRVGERRLAASAKTTENAEVLAFFSAKGGCGSTTLAVQLGLNLALHARKRVLLVDASPALGHVFLYLGLDAKRFQFSELLRNVNRLDSELLRGFTARHSSGMLALASPEAADSEGMDLAALAKTLEFLRSEFDFVVLDAGLPVGERAMALAEAATQVYVVATPDVGAVRDLVCHVDHLHRVGVPDKKLQIVLNRSGSRFAISPEEIEQAIRRPVEYRLPNAFGDLIRSSNRGEASTGNAEKSEFAQKMLSWSQQLAGIAQEPAEPQAKKEKSRLGLWKQVLLPAPAR